MKYDARHFAFHVDGGVATLTLNRPERKNPLTFDSYAARGRTFVRGATSTTSSGP
jgi:enoyl-CoA hydratase/carnithine racemase